MDEEKLSKDEIVLVAERMWRELASRLPAAELGRIRGLLDILSLRAEPRLHPKQGTLGRWFMPDLPSSGWMERAAFEPLASRLEPLFADLRREAEACRFHPYGYTSDEPDVRPDGVAPGWEELRLWEDFKPTVEVLRLPVAARALRMILDTSSLVNYVAYLAMEPGTELPVHHDRANWYVSVHLGLVVPPGCALRVAGEERRWEEGKCLFFDNSFAHDAWNKGDARRIVFAVHLAHPRTTAVEREALRLLQLRHQSLSRLGEAATIAWARTETDDG
jgi:hypothetical protein